MIIETLVCKADGSQVIETIDVSEGYFEHHEPEHIVTDTEQLRADVDYIAAMAGIDL